MIDWIKAFFMFFGFYTVIACITVGGWLLVERFSAAGKQRRADRDQLGHRTHFVDGPIIVVWGETRRKAIQKLTATRRAPTRRVHVPRIWE